MASIQTGIQLQDNFTNTIMGIINSVNLAVSAMEDMNRAMSTGVDTASIAGARNEINQATIAAQQLSQAFENMDSPATSSPTVPTPQPVPQTVEWQSDGLEVFNNSGIERYQQEIRSVNAMLSTLNEHQITIDNTASNLNILPDGAIRDITGIHDRIQGIILRIQEIESNPINMGTDRTNNELERLRSQLNQALSEQENLNQAVNDMDVAAANTAYMRLSQTISSTERYIRNNISDQENFNRAVGECHPQANRVTGEFAGWQKAIIVANNAIGLIKNTLGRLGVMNMSGAFDRIDTMNQFQKTVSIMTGDSNMANAALESLKDTALGTAYGLDVASKATQGFLTRGMSLGAATNQVRIWADAVSFYGKGTNEQLQNVVDAIGKMYSKGKVEAVQLDRLFDAGIGAAEIYAKAVGQSVSEVKDELSDGEISAAQFIQTVSDALDKGVSAGAAKDAGATWATTFANMQAAITRGWTNIITNIDNELAARGLPSTMEMVTAFGQKVESVLNSVGDSMGFVVDCVMNVYDVMSQVGTFVADNWSIIEPIIWGVVAAVVAFKLAHACMSVIAFLVNTVAAAYGIEASQVTAVTIAQWGLNAAMKAFSSIAIVALIGAIVAGLVYVNNELGSLKITLLVFKQIFMTTWENFLYALTLVEVGVAKFVAKFNVAFYSVGQAIEVIMSSMSADVLTIIQDMVNGAIDLINSLINTVNKIPGVSIETVQNVTFGTEAQIEAEARRQTAQNNIDSYAQQQQANADAVQKWSDDYYNKIIKNQADREAEIDKAMAEQAAEKVKKQEDTHNNVNYNDVLGSTAVNTGNTAKNTAKVADAVTATSEDLKYLRELAETDYINRFTTAEIKVEQINNNNINNEMDLDGVTEHLRSALEEQMFAAAEGVH